MSFVYCPECGFQNPEASNYCARCGALLTKEEGVPETTMTFTPEDLEEVEGELADAGFRGPALVVRSGGGRTGEMFRPVGETTTIGRSPDCDIFLDDVTVSRRHAALSQKNDGLHVEDLGSLNGTFLNRRRIETARLSDGDELQIGKYRMTFLAG